MIRKLTNSLKKII